MDDKNILLEQYKLYVEMADRISQRRAQSNQFYIALLSSILIVLSIIIQKELFSGYQLVTLSTVSILGIFVSVLWHVNIKSYRQLNTGKFQVINDMENELPYMCYKREWEILGEGADNKKYRQLTRIEIYIPYVLSIPYLLLLFYSISQLLKQS